MATPVYLRQWWAPRQWTAALAGLLRKEKKHPFDHRYGVDTDGLIYADAAAEGHAGARHNAGYYATAPSLFHGAMELWRATLTGTGYAREDYALVDIGCGKGRVLMMAAAYPFREMVGVELNPALARVARKNLKKFRRRRPASHPHLKSEMWGTLWNWMQWVPQVSILRPGRLGPRVQILEGDALTAPLPDGPLALFYFNSFEQEMMEMWLARLGKIARARTHPLDLIYIHPEFDALVRQVPGMRVMAEAEIPFSEEDAAADVFGVASDTCVIYREVNGAKS